MFPPGPERDDDDGGVVLRAVLQRLKDTQRLWLARPPRLGPAGHRQSDVEDERDSGISAYLLSDDVRGLRGVLALADHVADLLVAKQEVDAVGGESEEGVIGVLHLRRQMGAQVLC